MVDRETGAEPSRDEGTPEAPRWRARLRRARRIVVRSALGLLGFVVLLLVLTLYTSLLSRAGVRGGLAVYNGMIPGEIQVEEVDGALGRQLRLRGLSVRDSTGRELVAVEELSLGLRVGRLFAATVDAGDVELEGVVVRLPGDDRGGFGDLAPPSDEPPPPPDPDAGIGPDLPVTIELALAIDGFSLVQEQPEQEADAPLLELAWLELDAHAQGSEARAELTLATGVPVAGDLDVKRLELGLRWTSPSLFVDRLAVESNWVDLVVEPLELDVEALAGRVDAGVEASAPWFADLTGLRPDADPTLRIDAQGEPEDASAGVEAQLPGMARASLSVRGGVEPGVSLDLRADLHAVPRRLAGGLSAESVNATLELYATERDAGRYAARAVLRCLDCDPEGPPVTLRVTAEGSPSEREGLAELRLEAAQTTVSAQASLQRGNRVELDAYVEAPDLASVADVVGHLVSRPALRGRGAAQIECSGELSPRDLRCDVNALLEQLPPLEHARVDLTARLDETSVEAELRELSVGVEGLTAEQRGPPLRASYGLDTGTLELADVGLALSSARGDARVSLEGGISPHGENDLRLGVRALDLGILESFAPGLGLAGQVELDLSVLGTGRAPLANASIRGRRLRYRGRGLGALDARADYRDGLASLSASVRDSPAGDVSLRAALPVDVDIEAGRFAPRPEPWSLALRLRGAEIERLVEFAPGPPPASGRADLDLEVLGGPSPRVDLGVALTDLSFDGHRLGGARLDAHHRGARTRARIDLSHPDTKDAYVEVEVPLRLDLSLDHPGASWRRQADHRLRVHVGSLRLAGLDTWIPGLGLEGQLGLDARMKGSALAPTITAHVSGSGLRHREREIGSISLDLGHSGELAVVALRGRSPLARRIALDASVPIRLSPGRTSSPFTWYADRPHRAALQVEGLELGQLEPWLDGAVQLSGAGDLDLTVEGNAHAPELTLGLALRDVKVDEGQVGDVQLDAALDARSARAELAVLVGPGQSVAMSANVPLDLDPAAGNFAWRERDPHELELRVVNLDPKALREFLELPEPLDFALDFDLEGRGHLDDFLVDGRLRGGVGTAGVLQPLELELALRPDHQDLALHLGGGPSGALDVGATLRLSVPDVVRGTGGPPGDSPIDAHLHADALSLALADPFLPEQLYQLEGSLSAELEVTGPLTKPAIAGAVDVDDAGLTVVPMRQRFTDIGIDVELERDEVRLERFVARAGQGQLELSGDLRHAGPRLDGEFALRTQKLPLEQPGIPRMAIDTRVATTVHVEPGLTRVDVDVQGALVDVKSTNVAAPKAIPHAERVVYVDRVAKAKAAVMPTASTGAEAGVTASQDEEGTEVPPAPAGATRIEVVLSEPVELRGPAIDMAWEGAVQLVQGAGEDSATGSITNTEGTFDLLSNEFEVRRGIVTIPPGQDLIPYLDIEATTQIDDYEITATIRGRATRPELRLSSVPAADESTIFGMLVSGTSTPDDGPDTAKQAASLLAAFSSPALERQVNQALGVDKVGVTFGETAAQPILTVGKNLSKEVYVETRYQFGADPSDITKNKAELGLRYRFKPQWSVETFFGDAPAGGAGVFWHKAFDAEPKRYWIVPEGAEPVPAARGDRSPDASSDEGR